MRIYSTRVLLPPEGEKALFILVLLFLGAVPLFALCPDTEDGKKFDFAEQKKYYLRRTYCFDRLFTLAAEVAFNNYLQGGGKRWGRSGSNYVVSTTHAFGQRVIANTTELFVGQIIGDDARYQRSTETKFLSRATHAFVGAFTARDRNGNTRPAWSRYIATGTGAFVSNQQLPYPKSAGNVAWSFGLGLTDKLGSTFLDEFGPDIKNKFRRKKVQLPRICCINTKNPKT